MMTRRFELNDNDMVQVSGGNYGDKANDNARYPKYSYKTWVEVFNTPLHITTTRYMIKRGVKKSEDDFWSYIVYDGNDGSEKTITANDIERK